MGYYKRESYGLGGIASFACAYIEGKVVAFRITGRMPVLRAMLCNRAVSAQKRINYLPEGTARFISRNFGDDYVAAMRDIITGGEASAPRRERKAPPPRAPDGDDPPPAYEYAECDLGAEGVYGHCD